MSRLNRIHAVLVLSLIALLVGALYFMFGHPNIDPNWAEHPVTKGDIYICTALLIMFGGSK